MNRIILNNSLRFLLLIFFQVMVINNIDFPVMINPYIYPMFIALLPFSLPAWALMLLALAIGLGIDLFSASYGLHAAASVLIAFLRPHIINFITPPSGYENTTRPSIRNFGLVWFATYLGMLIFIHHFTVLFLEVLSFSQLLFTLSKILFSSLVSLIIIIILEYIFTSNKRVK